MTREPTTRTCLTVKVRQLRSLRQVSELTGASASELMRRALDAYLADRVAGYVIGPLRTNSDPYENGSTASTTN